MSVIAWDGKTLAADRRASLGGLFRTTTKVFNVSGTLVGYSGEAARGEEAKEWFRLSQEPKDFPQALRDKGEYFCLLVIWLSGEIWLFENSPYPMKFPPQQFAIGSGRDFALAAMHLGKTAAQAVEVACVFDSGCGNGVDVLTHGGEDERAC